MATKPQHPHTDTDTSAPPSLCPLIPLNTQLQGVRTVSAPLQILSTALNINLTLKAEEIQNDLKLIQTSKRPGSMAMLEDDRHLKAPKI